MKWMLIFLTLIVGVANAGYTVTWTAPTENTDGSPLTDLAGFKLWCIPADRTYGEPMVFRDPLKTSYTSQWASPAGDWKCKMQAFNETGFDSKDSAEVLWTCVDPDGDGNCQSTTSIVISQPGEPDTVIECPDGAGACRSNVISVTRKGYYTITGPDNVWLTKADGSTRQLTTRDEAYEWITKDGRTGTFIINPPPYEVRFD